LGGDLAGAAGAAAGIAGGYRLPFTAIAMVLGVGGPPTATLTCLGVVAVAYLSNRLNPFEARKAPAAPQDIPPDADR
jgi:H+/Cl- antiporter ClcA